ncbi:hypothetical protein NEILACOT_03409 [Neisseria lactamica ATCC 23970]|uniref:Uncharacterized protein n=1 Tax=Neisseria lactamica ATCC 23970 TaxID=546265 RepID=D0W7B1_NEILA|nr:hypothetical protein NEILACOT_03409 [Neisseria lactamica ATCC 23970]
MSERRDTLADRRNTRGGVDKSSFKKGVLPKHILCGFNAGR